MHANGNATSFVWTPSIGLSNPNIASPVANPTATTTYTVTGSNGGCVGTASLTVSVGSLPPTASISGNTALGCSGGSTTLTASGGGMVCSYHWNTGSVVVTAGSSPVISITGASAPICNGGSATLLASGGNTYTWSNGCMTNINTVSPITSTTYTVTAANSCTTATSSVTVLVNQPSAINVTGNANICGSGFTWLTANGANSYSWSPALGLNSTTGAAVLAQPTITTTYTVVGISNGGCSSSNNVTINVSAVPVINVSPSSGNVCSGTATTLTASGAITYAWAGSGLQSTSGANVTAIPISTGSVTYTVTGTSNGCSASATTSVVVNASPNVQVTDGSICNSSFATLTASGANTYTWSNGGFGPTINVSPVSTMYFTVTGTSNGCSNSATALVTVNDLVIDSATYSAPSLGMAAGTLTFIGTFPSCGISIQVNGHTITANTITGNLVSFDVLLTGPTAINLISDCGCAVQYQYHPNTSGIDEYSLNNKKDKDLHIYNLLGQPVNGNNLTPGVYIRGGKKFVVTERK